MKKIISIIISIVLMSVMSVSSFAAPSPTATTPKPTKTITTTTKTGIVIVPMTKVIPVTKNRIKLSWPVVKGAKKYQIFRAVGTNKSYVLISTTTATSYIDKNIKPGSYTYKIRALIDGSYKDSAIFTASLMNVNASPKIKTTKSRKNRTLKVAVKKNMVGATGYQIKYSLKNLKKSKNLKAAKSKTLSANKKYLIIKKVNPNKKHYIRVRAYQIIKNKRVYGKWSNVDVIK